MKHINKFLLTLAFLLSLWQAQAQTSCSSPVNINSSTDTLISQTGSATYYFKFVATDTLIYFDVGYYDTSSVHVKQISLYDGNCSSPTLISSFIGPLSDSLPLMEVSYNNFTVGDSYIVKLDLDASIASSYKVLLYAYSFSTCNYVVNGGFDVNTYCPQLPTPGLGMTGNPLVGTWSQGNASTADYYNTCSSTGTGSAPNIVIGNPANQLPYPANGTGYVGLYVSDPSSSNTHYEYVRGQISPALTAGQQYYLSMQYANDAQYYSDGLGMYLSTGSGYSSSSTTGGLYAPTVTPQLSNPSGSIMTNTVFALMGHCYTATGGEQSVTLGNFKPTASTFYTVRCTTCTSLPGGSYYVLDDIRITPLSVSAGPDINACVSAVLQASVQCTLPAGVDTYSWAPSTGLSSTTVLNPTASPSVTTHYTVTMTVHNTDGTTCTFSDDMIYYKQVVITPSTHTICAGGSATLSATGATSYTWNPHNQTGITIVVSPTATTVYTVTGAGGCTATATVVVNNGPTVTTPGPICAGQSTVITASGASTYSWSTGATTASISVSPTTTTVYTVTGFPTGCTSQVTVTVNPPITLTVTATPSVICSGSSSTLTASGATTYSWSTGATTSSISVSPSVTTVYTVTGTTSGCSATATVALTVNAPPSLTLSPGSATICTGQSTTLTASGASTYSWSTGATTSSISVSPSSTTIYTITGTSAAGCVSTKTVGVTVNTTPTISATASPTAICPGAVATLSASGAATYSWSSGATTASTSVTPSVTTVYTVTGTSSGCQATAQTTVTVYPAPTLTLTASSATVCVGNSSTLTVSGANTYSWSTGATTASISVSPTVATVYTVTGTESTHGCSSTATIQVQISPYNCCVASNTTIGTSSTSTTNVTGGHGTSTSPIKIVDVQGVVTCTANTNFTNFIFRMAPGSRWQVNPGVTLTVNTCTFYACSDLWYGIELLSNGSGLAGNIELHDSRVEDMYAGITVDWANATVGSGGKITVTGTAFNKDYIGIQMRSAASYTDPQYPLSVVSSTFSSVYSPTSPYNTLKASSTYTYAYNNIGNANTSSTSSYTNFPRGFVGIALNSLSTQPAVVGDSSGFIGGTNVFDNLDFGVNTTNTTTWVQNNYFKNLTGSSKYTGYVLFDPPPTSPAGPPEIGVGVYSKNGNNRVYSLIVGTATTVPTAGNPYPKGNVFENCNKGVSANNVFKLTANGNYLTASSTDIVPQTLNLPNNLYYFYKAQSGIWSTGLGYYGSIIGNDVENMNAGIYNSHSLVTTSASSARIRIENNLVQAPGSSAYCMQAIQADQPASTSNLSPGMLTIKTNSIQSVYNGILATNVQAGLQINNNPTIAIEAAKTYGVPQDFFGNPLQITRTGISLSSCTDGVVADNPDIHSSGTISSTYYYNVLGIWLQSSGGTAGAVNCNTMSSLGRCMQFNGTCTNKVSKNVMTGTYQGLVLSSNGVIGQQGNSSLTVDNEWHSFTGGSAPYAETYVENTSNVNTASNMFVKPGSPYQPIANYTNGSGSAYITLGGQGIDVQSSSTTGETCLVLRPVGSGEKSTSVTNADTTNTGLFEAFTNDSLFYTVYQPEAHYRNQALVYNLVHNGALDSSNATLQNFYNDMQNSSQAAFASVVDNIAQGNYGQAANQNATVAANTTIEAYQQQVNGFLLTYIAYTQDSAQSLPSDQLKELYSATDLAILHNIANSCLDQYGQCVAQARILEQMIQNRYLVFQNNCDPKAQSRPGAETQQEAATISAKVVPNPNSGIFTIKYDLGNEPGARISIYDVNGRMIYQSELSASDKQLSVSSDRFGPGVYYYSILTKGGKRVSDKFVVIK